MPPLHKRPNQSRHWQLVGLITGLGIIGAWTAIWTNDLWGVKPTPYKGDNKKQES